MAIVASPADQRRGDVGGVTEVGAWQRGEQSAGRGETRGCQCARGCRRTILGQLGVGEVAKGHTLTLKRPVQIELMIITKLRLMFLPRRATI